MWLALGGGVTPGPAAAQPAGGEFRVNTTVSGEQSLPDVDLDAAGNFVLAWESPGQDGLLDIYARRFAASGIPLTGEIQANTHITGNQGNPSVSLDADGDFVVAWQSFGQDGDGDGIYAQHFAADGTALDDEIRVNTHITGNQRNPSVSLDADGDFVVVWEGPDQHGTGIYARHFAADGTGGDEIPVNMYTTGNQRAPSVSLDADGEFVVAWQSYGEDGDGDGIYAQRFAADGTALAAEIPVSMYTTGNQRAPSVSLDADGDFVVAWHSFGQGGSGYGYGVYARRFAPNGTPQGSETLVNIHTTGNQRNPSVSLDADGDFVVAWQSFGQDGDSYGIYARLFLGRGCYGEPLEEANRFVAGDERLDCVSYSAITAHDVLVEAGGELIFTAPAIGLGPGTIVEAGAVFKAGP